MKSITSTMSTRGQLSRRQFIQGAAGLGLSAAGLALLEACGIKPAAPTAAAESLETTTIRLTNAGTAICRAPQYVAEDFLKAEGFTDVQYVKPGATVNSVDLLVSGGADMTMGNSGPTILDLDAGKPITMLAGIEVGCFVLYGTDQIKEITDLKGKSVAITQLGASDHVFLSAILANVGLDPTKDVTWTLLPVDEQIQVLSKGKIDAMIAFPPNTYDAQKIGHVLVNSMMDKPWSQYFCCMATVRRDFAQNKPVATKRALRALLRAADSCALQPERAAKLMVDKGYVTNYDYALQGMKEIPWNRWREYNPEDTIRFYSLTLHGVGMVKSTPDEIIKRGTDWHFLNELKAELPATPFAPAPR